MHDKNSVREFLMARRAEVQPHQAGLPALGADRRVPGLRREEVAVLAGVSQDYYTCLERDHLFSLARNTASSIARQDKPVRSPQRIRESVQRVIDSMDVGAVVQNARQDVVAANALGRMLYAPIFELDDQPNLARFIFLDPRAQDYYVDWPLARRTASAMLRLEAGRNPLDEDLTSLIGELSTRSPVFRQDWANYDVHSHQTGTKSFRHPEVGRLEVDFDVFEMPGEPGLMIVTYGVQPGTPSAQAWSLLASMAATQQAEASAENTETETTPRAGTDTGYSDL